MTVWTVREVAIECGYCLRRVPAGQPIAFLSVSRKFRCPACAAGPIDWAEVEQARHELEARRAAQAAPSSLDTARPTPRAPRPKRPVPLSAVASTIFDPKAAAAGDRREE